MQCCLEPLGQYCIGFWPVKCYPKSIKTILHRISFYKRLPGASWTILHRVFRCAMFSQEYYDNFAQDFFFGIVAWHLLDIIA